MQIKKLFTMTCYFCEASETIDMPSQRRAVVKFFDDGWRVRADEDVCPKCTSVLPLKVSRRELSEVKARLLTKRAADETICTCSHDKYENINKPGHCMACGKPFHR